MKKFIMYTMMVILLLTAGCGGGGGGNGGDADPTVAVLKLSARPGTLPVGKAVSGFDVAIEMPSGVSVRTTAGGVVDSSVVTLSGVAGTNAILGPVIYTPATGTTGSRLAFSVVSTAIGGFGEGEYATVTLSLNGVSPAAGDFTISFSAIDLSYNPLSGFAVNTMVTLL